MRNLIAASVASAIARIGHEDYAAYCGMLNGPSKLNDIDYCEQHGIPWAADNDCYVGFNHDKFLRFLDRIAGRAPVFVNCPDVVFDAAATLERFERYAPEIEARGLPLAFTIQNGMHEYEVPWSRIAALFIGSNDDYRKTDHVPAYIVEAKQRGKWVHVGRVNSRQRILHYNSWGADSFDGSGFTYTVQIPFHLPYQKVRQPWLL